MSEARTPKPGYNTYVPESITTPADIVTRLGTIEFFDGIPTKTTATQLYDHLDYVRGFETFMNGMPAASLEAMRRGHESVGIEKFNQVAIFDDLMDSNSLFLTGNCDTVYCSSFFNVSKDGPMVIEIPPKTGPGTVNDAFFRFVIDTGPPGPDRGEGGKYLILPPDYEGEVPDGYHTAKTTSGWNWLILRGFLVDGKPDFSSKVFRDGLKIYPLSQAANPPKMEFTNASGVTFNTVHSNDYSFYEELHAVIDREPIEMLEPQLRGIFSSVGIQKGKPFAPDARMRAILSRAVEVANATARSFLWYERDESAFIYEDSYWKRGFVGGSYEFLKDEGMGGRNLDARVHFFYNATVNTPAMTWKLIGKGSQYAWGMLDASGDHLDGGKNYKLNIPKDVPAEQFWSVCVYDPQTRCILQTGQPFPSKNNTKDPLVPNDDGSVDLYFGPEAPAGKEANWIQTVPNKGWFCLWRIYSPTEPWFDRSWRLGDIELIP